MEKDSTQRLIDRLQAIHDHEPWNVRAHLMAFIKELEAAREKKLSTSETCTNTGIGVV